MRILVTGGAGFIGSYLVEKLILLNNDVIVLDNLSRGNLENLKECKNKFRFIKGNVNDLELVNSLVKGCEIVYHLAALSQVIPSIKNPKLCYDSNINGTLNVIKACKEFNAKLIFASSREYYGEQRNLPVSESVIANPKNPYAISKVCGEALIKELLDKYVILRLSNVVGKRDFDRVLPKFINKAKNNQEIKIMGEGKIIDFVDVVDVVSAFINSLSVKNEIINIGSGKGTSLDELATLIIKQTNSNSKVIKNKANKNEVSRFIANVKKAKELLDWKPMISLSQSIDKIVS